MQCFMYVIQHLEMLMLEARSVFIGGESLQWTVVLNRTMPNCEPLVYILSKEVFDHPANGWDPGTLLYLV